MFRVYPCCLSISLLALFWTTVCPAAPPSARPQPGGSDQGSSGGDDAGEANNPVSSLIQIQIQDAYSGSLDGTNSFGRDENQFLIKSIFPVPKLGFLPAETFRLDTPVYTTPDNHTAFGDLAGYEVLFFLDKPKFRVGLGGSFAFPTDTYHEAGAGKWELGPALVVAYTQIPKLVIVGIAENPISYAGNRNRPDVNGLIFQPVVIETLPKNFFLRFDPIMKFDWKRSGAATIPLNLGLGRVFRVGSQEVSAYIQPEWTVARPEDDRTVPRFTLRFDVTLLFPEKK